MIRCSFGLIMGLLLSSNGVAASEKAGVEVSDAWGKHRVWDDGLAEVAHYDAERIVYGKVRTFETIFITVKEDFNAAFHAKADPPYRGKKLLPILKLNMVYEIVTENYPYRYLTSVFVDRRDVSRPVKMTVGSQEWCGNTFKEFRSWGSGPEIVFHSYWDGQGDGTYSLDLREGDLLEEQLPLSLRALPFREGYRAETRIVSSLVNNKALRPRLRKMKIEVTGREALSVGGHDLPCWRVTVTGDEEHQTYWFEEAHPNILVKFESSDGRKLRLNARSRRKYW